MVSPLFTKPKYFDREHHDVLRINY